MIKKKLLVDWCLEKDNTLIPKEWDYNKNTSVDFYSVSSKSIQSVWWKCSICGYEWKARIGNRTANGSGCPACSHRVTRKGYNDLTTTHPELVKEWNYEKNGDALPSDYSAGSSRKVWWKCSKYGHEWKAVICSRTHGVGCPVCSGNVVVSGFNDLESKYSSLAKEWDYKKNHALLPSQVTVHSGKKVWWKCSVCGHEWKAEIKARVAGSGCPVCSRKTVWQGYNDFATMHPELVKEWDYEKNGDMLPSDYLKGSSVRVWWKCRVCGHEWKAQIKTRSSGFRCPKCARKIAKETFTNHLLERSNTISIRFPHLMSEWNYKKNTISPDRIAPFSREKVWWKCSVCGYEWKTAISARTRGIGCPACSNKTVWKGHNDLATTHPELAKEWDYEKNGNSLPSDYTAGSGVVKWWKCQRCGNEWETAINNRKGKPCPKCNSLVGTSEPEQFVFYYVKKAFSNAINRYKASWLKPYSEIDIYIPEINLAIEYDGQKWHQDVQKDIDKNIKIYTHVTDIIRFREENCPPINDRCFVIPVKSGDDDSLTAGIIALLKILSSKCSRTISLSVDLERDRLDVLSMYKKSIGENSLFYSGNDIVDEWDYEKNGDLSPKDFKCFSMAKVWWKCSNCGYEFQTRIKTRVRSRKGVCPFCSGRVVIEGKNDFASQRPDLLSEWDYEKNGDLLPTKITARSGKKVWWKCPICNRSWIAAVHDRTIKCNHKG